MRSRCRETSIRKVTSSSTYRRANTTHVTHLDHNKLWRKTASAKSQLNQGVLPTRQTRTRHASRTPVTTGSFRRRASSAHRLASHMAACPTLLVRGIRRGRVTLAVRRSLCSNAAKIIKRQAIRVSRGRKQRRWCFSSSRRRIELLAPLLTERARGRRSLCRRTRSNDPSCSLTTQSPHKTTS